MTKGVANHVSPELCGRSRKRPDEALTGGRRAGLLSREEVIKLRRSTFLATAGTASAVAKHASGRRLRRGRRTQARLQAFCTGTGRSRDRPREMAPGSALRTERERQ